MQERSTEYELIFPAAYEGQWEEERIYKGWLTGVKIRFPTGECYVLTFVDMHRLGQMVEDRAAEGCGYYAEPGLIIVSEVSRTHVDAAVRGLVKESFFDSLRPVES